MPQLSQRFTAIAARPRGERGAAYARLWNQTRQAWKAAQCPPWRCFLATAVTIPAFIFFGMAIRQCALAGLPGWAVGGSLWFTDLCAPDPMLILPAANAAVLLSNMFFAIPENPSSPFNTFMKDALLFLPLAVLPLTVIPHPR
jgi:membrane protein insertase Oxa1/YidC/SpoIIIJ